MTADDLVQLELMYNRFRRLMRELATGVTGRQSFMPWELALIVDYQQCTLPSKRRTDILRQYERAVERQMETGPGPPMKLSEFLTARELRRNRVSRQEPGGPEPGTSAPAPLG